jgi:hypothetical protein
MTKETPDLHILSCDFQEGFSLGQSKWLTLGHMTGTSLIGQFKYSNYKSDFSVM